MHVMRCDECADNLIETGMCTARKRFFHHGCETRRLYCKARQPRVRPANVTCQNHTLLLYRSMLMAACAESCTKNTLHLQ